MEKSRSGIEVAKSVRKLMKRALLLLPWKDGIKVAVEDRAAM